VAARSIALPFFPELTDAQVEQVVEALRAVIGRPA
jgi:dTDP-4-amino-4,6-dideoxygalactose transaminase